MANSELFEEEIELRNTQTFGNEKTTSSEGISWKRLPFAALLAALTAAIANALVYFATSALGFIPQSFLIRMTSGEMPLTVSVVAITSVVGTVGAAIVFAVIGLLTRRPVRLFRIIAVVVLVLSFAMPLTIPDAPVAMILSLEAMHVMAWAVIVGLLTTVARRKASA